MDSWPIVWSTGGVFIKVTRNSAGQAYYHLVESYREDSKVRHRTLLSLGRVEDGKLEALAGALAKHTCLLTAIEAAKSVAIEGNAFVLGPLLILERLFALLGVDRALDKIVDKHSKLEFDFRKTVFTLVASRFVRPTSKLAVFDELLRGFYPEMVDHDVGLQHLYRALDLLAEHKDELERSLYWHGRDLLTARVDVVLYDLTTLRFESTREDLGELRRFGYSKEKRNDCTQVILGLLVDTHGIPLGFEVYPGNRFEGDTLNDIVGKMRRKFNVGRFIFVADRGLFSADNLATLKADNGEFIVGMRLGRDSPQRRQLCDLSQFTWLDESFAFREVDREGDRCIVTWSKERAERDRKVREDILTKIRAKLAKKKVSTKSFVSNSNYQRFVTGLGQGETPRLNEGAIAEAQGRDGFFAILTNVKDKTVQELIRGYKQLWVVEDAFGELKGTLRARPVFHWTDQRIRGHLTMCFLAYLCEAHLTHVLRSTEALRDSRAAKTKAIKARPLSASQALRELSEVRAVKINAAGHALWVRTDIAGNAAQVFRALGVRIPPKLLNAPKQLVVAQTADGLVVP